MDKSPEFVERIGKVAALNDIGKVAIPEIIKLERSLSADEIEKMRMHTVFGAQILDRTGSLGKNVFGSEIFGVFLAIKDEFDAIYISRH